MVIFKIEPEKKYFMKSNFHEIYFIWHMWENSTLGKKEVFYGGFRH